VRGSILVNLELMHNMFLERLAVLEVALLSRPYQQEHYQVQQHGGLTSVSEQILFICIQI
jgi:hypothetical protein